MIPTSLTLADPPNLKAVHADVTTQTILLTVGNVRAIQETLAAATDKQFAVELQRAETDQKTLLPPLPDLDDEMPSQELAVKMTEYVDELNAINLAQVGVIADRREGAQLVAQTDAQVTQRVAETWCKILGVDPQQWEELPAWANLEALRVLEVHAMASPFPPSTM